MGLIKCPDCGNMVSERASACPSCGCPADAFGSVNTDPDFNLQMSREIVYEMSKTIDRRDLMLANNSVLDYLKNNLTASRNILFFSNENKDNVDNEFVQIAQKVMHGEYNFPYVMITSNFRFAHGYRKFSLTKTDGRTYSRYYDQETLPSEYSPRIEVISDKESEIIEITEKIKELFKEPKSFSVPFWGKKEETISFSCEIESVINGFESLFGAKKIIKQKSIVFKYSPWASFIDGEVYSEDNGQMMIYRKLQYAQFCLSYEDMREEINTQLKLYRHVFDSSSDNVFNSSQTAEYTTLKRLLQTGEHFDADIVDKAFPDISLIYHDLPNDIILHTPHNDVDMRVREILRQYKAMWKETCDEVNLPNDTIQLQGTKLSLREKTLLDVILKSLSKNYLTELDHICNMIKKNANDLEKENRAARASNYKPEPQRMARTSHYEPEPQRATRASYYEPEPQSQYYEGGSSIIGSVLKTAAGVALGNKLSSRGKQNYMGSPNCVRAKTGRHTSCWGCGLGEYCTMYHKK